MDPWDCLASLACLESPMPVREPVSENRTAKVDPCCVCMCVSACVHICMLTQTHTHMHTHVHTCTHACMHTHTCMHTGTHTSLKCICNPRQLWHSVICRHALNDFILSLWENPLTKSNLWEEKVYLAYTFRSQFVIERSQGGNLSRNLERNHITMLLAAHFQTCAYPVLIYSLGPLA